MAAKANTKMLYLVCKVGSTTDQWNTGDNARVFEASDDKEILSCIREYMDEYGHEEDEIEVYELGRKGILPKRTITFV